MIKRILIHILLVLSPLLIWAQDGTNSAYWAYIEKYKDLAMEQQQKYKIPASITLAQGLLESGAGRSRLATEANNHFGIKTPGGWTGPYIRVDDDRPNEKFRKYHSVRESYEDHSIFLKKPRYQKLFTYRITDYKAWAKGLKSCGYATSPVYAESLIRIIEMYDLHKLDTQKPSKRLLNRKDKQTAQVNVTTISKSALTSQSFNSKYNAKGEKGRISRNYLKRLSRGKIRASKIPPFFQNHAVVYNNDNYYIVVQEDDNLATISQATGVSIKKLLKYNDLDKSYTLTVGDIIYLRQKKKKAAKAYEGRFHIVQSGQSMYDISQIYGVKMKSLYKRNKLSIRKYRIKAGDKILLR